MAAFSIRQFVCEQHCVPWKLRLLIRRLIPWRFRRALTKGRTNLNRPDAMDTTYASLDDAFTSMDALYDRLVPLLPAEGKVLDAGCGIAVLLRRIASECPKLKLFGIDFSPVGVQRTREYGFEAEVAVLPDVPYPDDYFDGVVCTEVLEHLDDPVAAVRSFHRVVKPGGPLVVSVPRGMGPNYCDEHVQDFTAETIRECLARGGFDVQSVEPVVREPERCDAASFLVLATKPAPRREYGAEYYVRRPLHPMWAVEAELIAKLAGQAGKGNVVDVGCGAGDLLAGLAPDVGLGIDANGTAVQLAAGRFGQYMFRVGDATQLDLPDNSVDCIVSMHLIEHLHTPVDALAEWRRALRPGGRLVLTTPNGHFSHPEIFDDPDHKHIFTGRELARAARDAGLTVRRAFSIGLWGVRRCPLLWRWQGWFYRRRSRGLLGGKWRGQSLCLAAVKEGA